MRLSEIYGMDIYSDAGQYLGEVKDAVVDLETGIVSRLLMEEWRNTSETDAKRLLKQKSVLFKNVKNIGDVVLISAEGQTVKQADNDSEAVDLASK
ncbi:MAG: PRC-barrel domain-containing protein [Candidatus Micrarchaeia archaeon]